LYIYRGLTQGRYVEATLVMANGEEITGRCLIDALDVKPSAPNP
jgi:hypothetical protein